MGEKRISLLRARRIEDMRIRGLGEKAHAAHTPAIRDFAAFPGGSRPGHAGRSSGVSTAHDRRWGHALNVQRADRGAQVPLCDLPPEFPSV